MLESVTLLSIVQLIGVVFGALQVWYAKENKVVNYLFGIVSILITISVYYSSGLYAEIFLNLYYLLMSIYGWWYWKNRGAEKETPITYSSMIQWTQAAGLVLVTFLVFYFSLIKLTDSDVPMWDSLVTAFAWGGMWLLAKRKMENWIFLNVSNLISIPLLIYKELYIYAGFTVFLFAIAIFGYFNWRKIVRSQKSQSYEVNR
ncbi:MAG TPA: nicotinamide riboside transporter PnuC [Candidatus Sphingobacterium stercoripullorum]|uniref:Nicotinamide riboside transporter PnuC n=1 Tax=Candidatus Sphingobacterium stercoripullorum TaxID=2838759 RepID=A0A9D2AZ31_9SPHI|nr:nicotinamide riboside transporter PnuC [Candidatus Sphingobacterium stercoripullorum]